MKIQKLTEDNLSQILELESHSAPRPPHYVPYSEQALQFIFDNPKTCSSFGVFENEKMIGWGSYRTDWKDINKNSGIFEISSIVIDNNFRRMGLGKKLLKKLIDDIKSNQDFQKIYLTVSPVNIGALILYLNSGFVIFDYKKDVYGPGTDRLYLELNED